ncbi:MAG: gluconolactonase [Rhodospirillales bacterium]|nr:gluconolactonase [Rhodospirillales bacterium]
MRVCHALVGLLLASPFYLPSAVFAADMPVNLSVIRTIPGPDGGWDYASIDVEARRLYVAHGDAVTSVDLDSGKVNPQFAEGKHLHAVMPLADGKLLTTNGASDTANVFEAATGKLLATVPTGKSPDAAILDPSSGLILVMDGHGGDITLIDPKTFTSPGRIDVGGTLEFAVADGHGKVYVNIEDKGEVAVVDVTARKVVSHYALPDCEEPSGLALDPKTGIMVAACANNKAIAIKAKDGAIAATLAIGGHPDATIFDAKRQMFFIPCAEGNLAVIAAGEVPKVVASLKTAPGARTGALDTKTGNLYLPTADLQDPAPGEKRRAVVPGTFRILVVGEK